MTQNEIVDALAEGYDLSRSKARGIYETIVTMIEDALVKGDDVDLRGLFKITVKRTKARMGRNPFTGKKMKIKAKNRLSFKPKARLKKLINE